VVNRFFFFSSCFLLVSSFAGYRQGFIVDFFSDHRTEDEVWAGGVRKYAVVFGTYTTVQSSFRRGAVDCSRGGVVSRLDHSGVALCFLSSQFLSLSCQI